MIMINRLYVLADPFWWPHLCKGFMSWSSCCWALKLSRRLSDIGQTILASMHNLSSASMPLQLENLKLKSVRKLWMHASVGRTMKEDKVVQMQSVCTMFTLLDITFWKALIQKIGQFLSSRTSSSAGTRRSSLKPVAFDKNWKIISSVTWSSSEQSITIRKGQLRWIGEESSVEIQNGLDGVKNAGRS